MHRHTGTSVFLITKPLPLMVSLCIASEDMFEAKPIFLITDTFYGASEVEKKLCTNFTEIQTSKFFTSQDLAYSYIINSKFNNIFIDSDVGLQKFITLLKIKARNYDSSIFVYEEGVGAYRGDLYSGVKKTIFEAFGIGVFFGGCRLIKGIYVYQGDRYRDQFPDNALKVRVISGALKDFIISHKIDFDNVFQYSGIIPSSENIKSCSIYLSTWLVNHNFLSVFKGFEGDLLIKLHPHNRINLSMDNVKIIEPGVPAELMLLDVISKYESVNVFDHNSSVRIYIAADNLIYSNLEDILMPESITQLPDASRTLIPDENK